METTSTATLSVRPAQPQAPAGWSVGWSNSYKRWYFVNNDTKVTQWKRPGLPAAELDASAQQPQRQSRAGPDSASGSGDLPLGWESRWSEEHHHHYYLNTSTGVSQWEKPQDATVDARSSDRLGLPSQSSHTRSSSQPPLRTNRMPVEQTHPDTSAGDLFSNPQNREKQLACDTQVAGVERPKSHCISDSAFAPPPPMSNSGIVTPPSGPESSHSSPAMKATRSSSPKYGSKDSNDVTPLSPIPSALNPFSQPHVISRPSSRNSEAQILPAYSYVEGFTSKYSSYQGAMPSDGAGSKYAPWNPNSNSAGPQGAAGYTAAAS